ncbi:protein-disulfide reductase DsbD domain-containing protein [Anaplasma capra]|uniref:protein-disulfide reductase DsbD domain-containing protein n=1 Tax=Anaplasma capra TaxID=1562740 RepID=UPI0021D5CA8E|nr:protein-disulfide reductase DsbD domain-containing protein [Anaplasma capra]MCU7611411.1 protein-disulfide reductase DsbD family protein [Anaplasma capra]MCU7612150.1 protein-disulfide reductase DsbD family protein [Anaplasma capra]
MRFAVLQLSLLLCCAPVAHADDGKYLNHVNTKAAVGSVTGNVVSAAVTFDIESGWHICAQEPGDTGMPTVFSFESEEVTKHNVHWPKHSEVTDKANGKTLNSRVYSGTVVFPVTFEIAEGVKQVRLNVSFAACGPSCIPQSRILALDVPETGFEDGATLSLIDEWKGK